jgi:hypothetical protein
MDSQERLYEKLDRIEAKLDVFVQRLTVLEAYDAHNRLLKQDERIQKLEGRLNWFAGAAAGLGTLGGHFLHKLLG